MKINIISKSMKARKLIVSFRPLLMEERAFELRRKRVAVTVVFVSWEQKCTIGPRPKMFYIVARYRRPVLEDSRQWDGM